MEELNKENAKIVKKYKKECELPCYILTPVDGEPSITDSKMGGFPYLPVGASVPKDANGKPMALFIQLNLEGLPYMDGYPVDYPNKGIIQVFMANDSSEFPTPHKVVYYDTIGEYTPDDGSMNKNDWVSSPFKLKAELGKSYLPVRFATIGEDFLAQFYKNRNDVNFEILSDAINECIPLAIFGGHADTTQSMDFDYMENAVLFKIDSMLDGRINLGDCGILTAGIPFEALAQNDFDKAFVKWDCC